jgi:hypothetical protein
MRLRLRLCRWLESEEISEEDSTHEAVSALCIVSRFDDYVL